MSILFIFTSKYPFTYLSGFFFSTLRSHGLSGLSEAGGWRRRHRTVASALCFGQVGQRQGRPGGAQGRSKNLSVRKVAFSMAWCFHYDEVVFGRVFLMAYKPTNITGG